MGEYKKQSDRIYFSNRNETENVSEFPVYHKVTVIVGRRFIHDEELGGIDIQLAEIGLERRGWMVGRPTEPQTLWSNTIIPIGDTRQGLNDCYVGQTIEDVFVSNPTEAPQKLKLKINRREYQELLQNVQRDLPGARLLLLYSTETRQNRSN